MLAVLLVASCGSGKPSLEVTHAPSSVTVTTATIGGLGQILASGGHTLYVFPPDHRAAVLCDGACQGTWPALTVTRDGRVAAGSGADPAKLGTIAGRQVAAIEAALQIGDLDAFTPSAL